MNVAKFIVAIFTIVGISGLLYTSSFLPTVLAQGAAQTGPDDFRPGGVGTFEELQNLTQPGRELLTNGTAISNTSLSSGLELEQDTDQPNATAAANETDQQQADHDPQGQVGPALDPTATEQQQNQTGQQAGGQQQQQNQTGQAAGPLDQILEPFKGLLGGGQ